MNEEDADRAVGRLLREHATRHRAGDALQSAVRTEIALEAAGQRRQATPPAGRRWRWPAWGLAAAGFACGVLASAVTLHLLSPADGTRALEQELASSHVRALMVAHLTDVASSDQHTVKPWFQGKLPFSFNLPEPLPDDTKLEGANLTYLRNQPAALLLFSIGKHRVSVFISQRTSTGISAGFSAEHAGFHVAGFSTDDLQAVAVSDVDPARLSNLVATIEHAQTSPRKALP